MLAFTLNLKIAPGAVLAQSPDWRPIAVKRGNLLQFDGRIRIDSATGLGGRPGVGEANGWSEPLQPRRMLSSAVVGTFPSDDAPGVADLRSAMRGVPLRSAPA